MNCTSALFRDGTAPNTNASILVNGRDGGYAASCQFSTTTIFGFVLMTMSMVCTTAKAQGLVDERILHDLAMSWTHVAVLICVVVATGTSIVCAAVAWAELQTMCTYVLIGWFAMPFGGFSIVGMSLLLWKDSLLAAMKQFRNAHETEVKPDL